jgi:hypothetical protein
MLPPGVGFKNLTEVGVWEGSLIIRVALTDGREATITLPETECEKRAVVIGEQKLQ